ncbi:hypothetical protein KW805_03285 [Candidatus Pacearchaeota archaeon]|nr:hypothetical protein [Candidatus Pacearchaeota archaeon]
MAKPIRATPELRSTEARKFLEKMEKMEKAKITSKDVALAKEIESFNCLIG